MYFGIKKKSSYIFPPIGSLMGHIFHSEDILRIYSLDKMVQKKALYIFGKWIVASYIQANGWILVKFDTKYMERQSFNGLTQY